MQEAVRGVPLRIFTVLSWAKALCMHAQVNVEVVPDLLPVTSSFTARHFKNENWERAEEVHFYSADLKKKREREKTQISPSKANAGWERKEKKQYIYDHFLLVWLSGWTLGRMTLSPFMMEMTSQPKFWASTEGRSRGLSSTRPLQMSPYSSSLTQPPTFMATATDSWSTFLVSREQLLRAL